MAAALTRLRTSLTQNWPLKLLTLLALVVPVILLLRAWSSLPESVPVHFDASGTPDRFGPKGSLWILHWVSFGMWLMFTAIQALPLRSINLPVKVTPENAAHVQRVSARALSGVKFVMVLVLALIGQQTLKAAVGDDSGLSVWLMLLATLGPLPVLIWLVVAAGRKPTTGSAAR